MKKEDFHVDMSGRIYEKKTIGIAIVGVKTKKNYGCVIKSQLLTKIKEELFKDDFYYDSAKLYAICIFILINKVKDFIDELIICNDEDFKIVKKVLNLLLKKDNIKMINITEFRKRLGRNVGSFADNYAKIYRKRGLKPTRYNHGKRISVVKIGFNTIKRYWDELNQRSCK